MAPWLSRCVSRGIFLYGCTDSSQILTDFNHSYPEIVLPQTHGDDLVPLDGIDGTGGGSDSLRNSCPFCPISEASNHMSGIGAVVVVLLSSVVALLVSVYFRDRLANKKENALRYTKAFSAGTFLAIAIYSMIMPTMDVFHGSYGINSFNSLEWSWAPLFASNGIIFAYALHTLRTYMSQKSNLPVKPPKAFSNSPGVQPILGADGTDRSSAHETDILKVQDSFLFCLLEVPVAVHSLMIGLSANLSPSYFTRTLISLVLYHIFLGVSLAVNREGESRGTLASLVSGATLSIYGAMTSFGIILRLLTARFSPMWSLERLTATAIIEDFLGGVLAYECLSGLLPSITPDKWHNSPISGCVIGNVSFWSGSAAVIAIHL